MFDATRPPGPRPAEADAAQVRRRAGPDEVVARVEAASEAELEQWTERILSAETLEAVLG
jgi:hypothetical protein